MKIYRGRVRLKNHTGVASHFVDVEEEATGRRKFHFKRIVHNLDDHEKFPIPEMRAATFTEQLRSMNRAYAVTSVKKDQIEKFIEIMLKEAYPEAEKIEIEELD